MEGKSPHRLAREAWDREGAREYSMRDPLGGRETSRPPKERQSAAAPAVVVIAATGTGVVIVPSTGAGVVVAVVQIVIAVVVQIVVAVVVQIIVGGALVARLVLELDPDRRQNPIRRPGSVDLDEVPDDDGAFELECRRDEEVDAGNGPILAVDLLDDTLELQVLFVVVLLIVIAQGVFLAGGFELARR